MKVSQSPLTTGPISLPNSRTPSCGLFFGTCWTRWPPKGFFNVDHLFSLPTHLHLMFSSVLSTSGTSENILLVDRHHTCQSQSMWHRQLTGLYLQSHMGKHTHQCVHKEDDNMHNVDMHFTTFLLLPKLFIFSLCPEQPFLSELHLIFLTQMERKTWSQKSFFALWAVEPDRSDGLETRKVGF